MGPPDRDSATARTSLGAVETFTAEETARLAPHFTSVDGPVFALVNLPEVVKGALFARYSRSPKSLRRLFLDEFVDATAAAGGRGGRGGRHRPGGAALRADAGRVRRRLGGPAGRRPPRVRGRLQRAHQAPRVGPPHGLPRAVDPLRPLRRPAGRPLALSRAGRGPRRRASSPTSRRRSTTCSRPTPGGSSRCRSTSAAGTRAQPEDSEVVYRNTIRAKALDTLRGLLPAATRSNVGTLRHRPGVRGAPAAPARVAARRGAGVRRSHAGRAAQGDPGVPPARGRARPGRRLVRLPGGDARGRRRDRRPRAGRRRAPSRDRRWSWRTSIPRAR